MNAPAYIQEHRITIEYPTRAEERHSSHTKFLNPIVIEEDNSITKGEYINQTVFSRRDLNESITQPSRLMFLIQNIEAVQKNYNDLGIENPEVFDISFNLLQKFVINNMFDVNVSRTSQGELLFYRKRNDKFYNLLLDEDGDISFLSFTKKGEEDIKFFSKEDGFNYQNIVTLI